MSKLLDTVLLFSLPASGKSEVRKYLSSLTPEQCREEFHMGPTVQLDDYPYVHFMHRIDDECYARGGRYLFYKGPCRPFQDPIHWYTLIEMLNEDYTDLRAHKTYDVPSAAELLFDRLDAALLRAGAVPLMAELPHRIRKGVGEALEAECRKELDGRNAQAKMDLTGKTIVIEAARGGPNGAAFPLTPPVGYAAAFSQLLPEMLDRSAVLYVWVSPAESRRKNWERGRPDGQGSILFHSVPLEVMLGDYGCDDLAYLIEQSDQPDTVRVDRTIEIPDGKGGKSYAIKTWHLPVGRFDNRADLTTFVRKDKANWGKDEVKALHDGLSAAFRTLAAKL